MLRFVVTGTGRSATGYASRLFTAAGLPCGHEDWFRFAAGLRDVQAMPRTTVLAKIASPALRVREEARRRRTGLVGESSWMAVPRLALFRGKVFLQLRHPLMVIRSFQGTEFFTNPERNIAHYRFANAHFRPTGNDLVDAMRWWIQWNMRAARHADVIYRVESLDFELFSQLLEQLSVQHPEARARAALSAVSSDVNSSAQRGTKLRSLHWDDLPSSRLRQRLGELARISGYEPHDPGRVHGGGLVDRDAFLRHAAART